MTPILRLAQAVLDGSDAQARELATRIFDRDARAKRQRKAVVRAKPKAPRNETKALRRESRPERVAKIREAVFARAAGRCEWCGGRFGGCVGSGEWHHIIGGPLRRARESVETTAAICVNCHRAWERADIELQFTAAAWARERGFAAALAAIQHRIAKVNEARAVRAPGGTHHG